MSKDCDNVAVKGCSELVVGFALGSLVCCLFCFCACKSGHEVIKEQVPVVVTQEHHTESVRVDIVRDTIHQRDSVYHYIKGDTTIIERWHYYTTNNNAIKVDTLVRVDSVQVPVVTERIVTKVQQVEKPLHWWQKLLMCIGGLALIAVGIMTAYKIGKRK